VRRSGVLDLIVRANDIRGRVPDELDDDVAHALGAAFGTLTRPMGADGQPPGIVVGRDMRAHSATLCAAFVAGATSRGVDVTDIGLCATDELYFASGLLDLPGAVFTPSHNPADYGGVKLTGRRAAPMGLESGLAEVTALTGELLDDTDAGRRDAPPAAHPGVVRERDLLPEYAAHLRSLAPLNHIRPLRVVVDAGNGMAGLTAPAVFGGTPVEVEPLYFELDGTFPNHEANPLVPANLIDLSAAVVSAGADAGLAFDGDADRCFVLDENGATVPPSAIAALVAVRELARHPGAAVIHNLITSRAVPEVVVEHGGRPVRTRVGHSFIKAAMAQTGAVFGGEHSAHFYFRDFWGADSGMLAALHVLAALGEQDGALSDLTSGYTRYVGSGELNTTVADTAAALARIRSSSAELVALTGAADVTVDTLDGVTLVTPRWWLNVRPSNTEPVVRLNVEAPDEATMTLLRDHALAVVRGSATDRETYRRTDSKETTR